MMGPTRARLFVAVALAPTVAVAQPTLDSLWPNANGLRWDYEITIEDHTTAASFTTDAVMTLAGTTDTACGPGQVLHASHEIPPVGAVPTLDPILSSVWRARPDLRAVIASRYGNVRKADVGWWPLLLHDGYFVKTESSIRMAQPGNANCPTWTYLTSDLGVGATFVQQLIPDLTDDVFLHGTVEAVDAVVSAYDTTFSNAVRVRYVIDYGSAPPPLPGVCDSSITHSPRFETRGHVHYVPNVGPVDLVEEFVHAESDSACTMAVPPGCVCGSGLGGCFCCCGEQPGVSLETITMLLRQGPVDVAPTSWTAVKRLYR